MKLDYIIRNKLINGKPLELDNGLKITPMTYGEIQNVGYESYLEAMGLFNMNENDLKEYGNYKNFGEFLYNDFYKFADLKDISKKAFDCVIKENYVFIGKNGIILCDTSDVSKCLTVDNYEDFKKIISWQYLFNRNNKEIQDGDFNAGNKQAEEFIQKLKESAKRKAEKLAKTKNSEISKESNIDFSSISSYVLWKGLQGNKNLLYDMTIYEIYLAHKRLKTIEIEQYTMISLYTGHQKTESIKFEEISSDKIIKL